MKCEYHPDADAVEGCIRCQRLICEQCRVVVDGNVYCRHCLDELNSRKDGAEPCSTYLPDITLSEIAEPVNNDSCGQPKCRYHSNVNAVAVCAECGSPICTLCGHERAEKLLCNRCLEQYKPPPVRSGLGNTILILTLIVIVVSGIIVYRIVGKENPDLADSVSYAQSTFIDVQPPILKVTGEQVRLTNNSKATNPTFSELAAFLEKDSTDSLEYVTGERMCSAFAEMLHNNAELAGIRAAFVGVDIAGRPVGHALNAFETTDKGTVYIDCVGPESGHEDEPQPSDYDKIAYVAQGEPYGIISIDKAQSLEYSFYRNQSRKWDACEEMIAAYNREVKAFNEEVEGKVFDKGSQETAEIKEWKADIDRQKETIEEMLNELGNYRFTSPGIVEEITFYW